MSATGDRSRKAWSDLRRAQAIADTVDCSAEIVTVDGPCAADARPVLSRPPIPVGGIYYPLSAHMAEADRPRITWTCTTEQERFLRSRATISMLSGGERSGKTEAAMIWICAFALSRPGARCAVLLPSYKKAPAYEDKITALCGEVGGRWVASHRRRDYRYAFRNTSTIQFFARTTATGSETSYLGFEFDLFVLSELREFSYDDAVLHFRQAFSRIISRAGRMLVETSPEAGHYVEELATGTASTGHESVEVDVHHLSAKNNPFAKPLRHDPEQFFRLAEQLYPPDVYQRKVLGRYAQRADVDYYCFDRTKHVVSATGWRDMTDSLGASAYTWGSQCRARGKRIVQDNAYVKYRYVVGLDQAVNAYHFVIARMGCDGGEWSLGCESRVRYHICAEHQVMQAGLANAIKSLMSTRLLSCVPSREVAICPDPFALNFMRDAHNRNVVDTLANMGHPVLFMNRGSADKLMTREKTRDAVNSKFTANQLTIDPSCKVLIRSLLNFKSTDGKDTRRQSKDPLGQLPDALKILVSYWTPWDSISESIKGDSNA